ncbi:MAG: TIGR01459 family HAD-type hydrolase [Alphaproteobacteria bacterium]|nr:TIGR01459 family HAD-type hydrolase [Alphaproteobacteria bacterium]
MQDLSARYPVWLCDVWGVIHNGRSPFAVTVQSLVRHRAAGGTVILVTNSPRSRAGVEIQLRQIGVSPESHDAIVTSGDVTRDLMVQHGGGLLYHLGPQRDHSIFAGLDIRLTGLDDARAVICTGLFDDVNDRLEDYAPLLDDMVSRNLAMICANPDKIVRKGSDLLYCAGTLADMYAERGGKVLMAGKPFTPIYDLAVSEAARLRQAPVGRSDILAIGDGPETDIRGAADYGIDALLVAEGVMDASAGLAAAEALVRQQVPNARILRTVWDLAWA